MEASAALPKKQKKRWVRRRHKWVRNLLYPVLYPVCRFKYGARIEKFKEQGGRQYLILFNHQTAYDQFFVSAAFKGAVYYLASENILSNGFVSKLISFLATLAPDKPLLTLGILAAFFIVLNVLLFRSFIFKKRKKKE